MKRGNAMIKYPLWIRAWLAICRSPMMYKSYLFVSGRFRQAEYPDASNGFYLAGFQRSGNSYARRLLLSVFPELSLSSHIHKVAAIKSAIKLNLPVIVLLRDPSNTLASSIVQQKAKGYSNNRAYACIYEYIDYYSYVLDSLNKVNVVSFELLREPKLFIEAVRNTIPSLPAVTDQEILDASHSVIIGIKPNVNSSQVYAWQSDEKDNQKALVMTRINNLPQFKEATDIYVKILSRCGLSES